VLTIDVYPPQKTDKVYCFEYTQHVGFISKVSQFSRRLRTPKKSFTYRLSHAIKTTRRERFGYEGVNFEILHSPIWDSIYPLLYLTRNGGPLFNRHEEAVINFRYPIITTVKDFYFKRAKNFGIEIEITGPEHEAVFEGTTKGVAVAFGGGKESRLIWGILDELGLEPRLYSSLSLQETNYAADTPANISKPIGDFSLANRVMPTLMSQSSKAYIGMGISECERTNPWHQYYDFSNRALTEFSDLLFSLGLNTKCLSPMAVVPYNIIQRILTERYPKKYAGQMSVSPGSRNVKNLQISLCKLYHSIDFSSHCDTRLFRSLLSGFVHAQLRNPEDFGPRNGRRFAVMEMRSLTYHLREHELLTDVKALIPDEWKGEWIDNIHLYVAPNTEPGFVEIYSQYAKSIQKSVNKDECLVAGF